MSNLNKINGDSLEKKIAKLFTDAHTPWPETKVIDWPDVFARKVVAMLDEQTSPKTEDVMELDNLRKLLVSHAGGLQFASNPIAYSALTKYIEQEKAEAYHNGRYELAASLIPELEKELTKFEGEPNGR